MIRFVEWFIQADSHANALLWECLCFDNHDFPNLRKKFGSIADFSDSSTAMSVGNCFHPHRSEDLDCLVDYRVLKVCTYPADHEECFTVLLRDSTICLSSVNEALEYAVFKLCFVAYLGLHSRVPLVALFLAVSYEE